jgi:hypothetical protein
MYLDQEKYVDLVDHDQIQAKYLMMYLLKQKTFIIHIKFWFSFGSICFYTIFRHFFIKSIKKKIIEKNKYILVDLRFASFR